MDRVFICHWGMPNSNQGRTDQAGQCARASKNYEMFGFNQQYVEEEKISANSSCNIKLPFCKE
jgi:hypothetical protein